MYLCTRVRRNKSVMPVQNTEHKKIFIYCNAFINVAYVLIKALHFIRIISLANR